MGRKNLPTDDTIIDQQNIKTILITGSAYRRWMTRVPRDRSKIKKDTTTNFKNKLKKNDSKMNITPKRERGSLCLRNHSQAKTHLFAYIVIAFVSPIHKSGFGRWPKRRGQRNYPTYKRPSLATRYEEGQQTRILLMIILYYINPCISPLG